MSELLSDHIRVVLFDHDDTLVATIGPKFRQHKALARQFFGLDVTDADMCRYWGLPFPDMMRRIYGEHNADAALDISRQVKGAYQKELYPATIPTLLQLKAAGKILGTVSSSSWLGVQQDHDAFGLPTTCFDWLQTTEDTRYHKPDPRVFGPVVEWLGACGIAPGNVLYVGDSEDDMHAATGAGFDFVGVETGLVKAERWRVLGAESMRCIGDLCLRVLNEPVRMTPSWVGTTP